MPVQQTDIDALNAAIANGERIVRLGNKTVEYRSVAELIAARNDLRSQMVGESGTRRPRQTLLTQSGRGYE